MDGTNSVKWNLVMDIASYPIILLFVKSQGNQNVHYVNIWFWSHIYIPYISWSVGSPGCIPHGLHLHNSTPPHQGFKKVCLSLFCIHNASLGKFFFLFIFYHWRPKLFHRWSFLHSAEAIRKQEFSESLPRPSIQDVSTILMGAGYEVVVPQLMLNYLFICLYIL